MKTKVSIDLPTRDKLVAGLTTRELHPALVRAEEELAKSEQALERARRELADRERQVSDLPTRIQRGEARASALADALRARDAAALLIPPAEAALTKARARVPVEEKNAQSAREREILRRWKELDRAAAELKPVLEEISALTYALSRELGPGFPTSPDWPCSPACDAGSRAVTLGTAVVSASLVTK